MLCAVFAGSCGDSSDTDQGDGSGNGGSGGLIPTGGHGGSAATDGNFLTDGSTGGGAGMNPDAACASTSSDGQRLPLYMVLLLDRSCSMEEYDNNQQHLDLSNPNAKWNQVTGALDSFFASADSAGMNVALILFPFGQQSQWCSNTPYQTPSTAIVALPDATTIAAAMTANNPAAFGCTATPTSFALQGAVTYATGLQQQYGSTSKVVIVMATDGYPQSCNGLQDGDVGPACTVAASAAATIPTYVIGVGDQLQNLNELAAAGGTTSAFLNLDMGSSVRRDRTADRPEHHSRCGLVLRVCDAHAACGQAARHPRGKCDLHAYRWNADRASLRQGLHRSGFALRQPNGTDHDRYLPSDVRCHQGGSDGEDPAIGGCQAIGGPIK